MANEEHLRILRSGVAEWNRWRRTNSVAPDLDEAILTGAKLRDVDLMWVTLRGANLVRADLHSANLHDANLCGADVSRADLSQANLTGAIFGGTKLRKAKVTGATLWAVYSQMFRYLESWGLKRRSILDHLISALVRSNTPLFVSSNIRRSNSVSDHVVVVHGSNWGKEGSVVEVTESRSRNLLFLYRVRFSDDTSAIFFAFELKRKES